MCEVVWSLIRVAHQSWLRLRTAERHGALRWVMRTRDTILTFLKERDLCCPAAPWCVNVNVCLSVISDTEHMQTLYVLLVFGAHHKCAHDEIPAPPYNFAAQEYYEPTGHGRRTTSNSYEPIRIHVITQNLAALDSARQSF